jgi:hypothetical protein
MINGGVQSIIKYKSIGIRKSLTARQTMRVFTGLAEVGAMETIVYFRGNVNNHFYCVWTTFAVQRGSLGTIAIIQTLENHGRVLFGLGDEVIRSC